MASEIGQIEVDPKSLGKALKEKGLWVPPNQRDYAWEREHVKDLYDDFQLALKNRTREYFLGSVVIIPNDNRTRFMVVDGQQRLATTAILLAAIRDYQDQNGDKEGAEITQREFLLSQHRRTRVHKPHLSLNESDHAYFEKRILLPPSDQQRQSLTRPTKPSHKLIDKAAMLAAQRVKDVLKGLREEDRLETLQEWTDFIEQNAIVMWVEVPDESSAYKIFETMNDRGLELSANDLIKNYLLANASKERFEEIKSNWLSMNATIEFLSEKEIKMTYLRHYWISQYGRVRNHELFDGIKRKHKNELGVMQLSADLLSQASDYVALATPSHSLWSRQEFRHIVPKSIEVLNILGVRQMRPLFLSALKHFKPKETAKLFQMAVAWAVRLTVAGRQGTGTLESLYSDISLQVAQGELKTAAGVRKEMLKEVPNDELFKQRFSEATVSNGEIARYYLRSLELKLNGANEPHLMVPNENANEVTLEHILPENPEDKWKDIPAEVFETHTRRLGNMALLSLKDNSNHAGNEGFDTKKAILSDSKQYKLTQWAGKYDKWNAQTIEERQNRMADLAIKTWPLKSLN